MSGRYPVASLGGDTGRVSLTGHIGYSDSPVRAFFADRLGDTGGLVKEGAGLLRQGRRRPDLPPAETVNSGRAGTAVDLLIRFGLSGRPVPAGSAPFVGARMLSRRLPQAQDMLLGALEDVRVLRAHEAALDDVPWEQLARISLVLTALETTFRYGMAPEVLLDPPEPLTGDWRQWAQLLASEAEVEDVALLGAAGVEDHAELRGRPVRCNPTFAMSVALGGADADLVCGRGGLIDFKSTKTTAVFRTLDVWQLCGYALADTRDEMGITSVGISALRWRTRVSWPLEEFLGRLAGEPVRVADLREQFADMLRSSSPHVARLVDDALLQPAVHDGQRRG